MLPRYYQNLNPYLKPGQVLVIYGPRRAGKTTLIDAYLTTTPLRFKLDSGDNLKVQNVLSSQDFDQILPYAEGYDLLVIDEAQNIKGVGQGLKILCDQLPHLKIIATGSSSFELSGQIGEPLTGRKITLTLYPLSQMELLKVYNPHELKQHLEDFLIFGSYPKVLTTNTTAEKINILTELRDSYLLKDILTLERVKGSQVILDLLKLIAFQVGSPASLSELAQQLSIDTKTVSRYLDLLEKSFILVSVTAFSNNLRDELRHKKKYYFLDNGVRNAVISQFNPLSTRNDIGQLWENFIVSERLKFRSLSNSYAATYFWKSYSGQEIDIIEDKDGIKTAFECKWSTQKSASIPHQWHQSYPDSPYHIITKSNYLNFLIPHSTAQNH